MKYTSALVLAMVAGLPSAAQAAKNFEFVPADQVGYQRVMRDGTVFNTPPTQQRFGARAEGSVLQLGAGPAFATATSGLCAAGWFNFAGFTRFMNDINFSAPSGGGTGPWTGKTNNFLTDLNVLTSRATGSGTAVTDVRVRFFRGADFSLSPSVVDFVANPNLQLINSATYPNITLAAGITYLTLGGLDLVLAQDNGYFLEVTHLVPGASVVTVQPISSNFGFGVMQTATASRVGFSPTPDLMLEQDSLVATGDANTQVLEGGPVAEDFLTGAGAIDRVVIPGSSFTAVSIPCGGLFLNPGISIAGELGDPAPTVAPANDFGTLADGSVTKSGTLNNDIVWFKFTLPNDCTDEAGRFIDIDTEGSTALTRLGLFYENGRVAGGVVSPSGIAPLNTGLDDDDGNNSASQLTYGGIGIRPKVGNGNQYNGRDGELFAGTYYLAVAPQGTTMGNGFFVGSGAGTGAFNVNISTNVVSGAAAPITLPDLNQDYGTLVSTAPGTSAPGNLGNPATVVDNGVAWFKFNLPGAINICTATANRYLDIDFSRSSPYLSGTAPVFAIAWVYDAQGNLVLGNTIRGGAEGPGWPQISIGADGTEDDIAGTAARGPYQVTPAALPTFNGSAGGLSNGEYYVAVTTFVGLQPATQFGTDAFDRFHARPGYDGFGDLEDLSVIMDIYTNADPGSIDCVADYDDGTGTGVKDCGVGIEDLLFYLAAFEAGTVNADVDDGSGTGVKDGGVGIEDLLYYLFRFEAGC